MEKLSYTKIDTFKKCPKQFMHIYVKKDVISKDSEALRYGEFLHSVLEDIGEIVKANENKIPDNLRDMATASWRKHAETYKISPKLREESRSILSSYGKILRDNNLNGFSIIDNERKFNLKVGSFTITGKIDQVLSRDENILIRDYKTNKEQKYLLQDPLQLKIYVLAASKELGLKPEQLQASFMFLRFDCEEEPMKFSSKDIRETEIFLESIGLQIKNAIETNDFKPVVGPLCPYCPAIDKCQAAQGQMWIMRKYAELKTQGKV